MRAPDDVFAQIYAELATAEQSGELDQLFKGEPRAPDQRAGREPLMRSLRPDVKLYKSTFKKILGYDITTPGFAEEALTRLEILGCSRAREYYETVKAEWQQEHDAQMKSVAHWYKGQCENEFENMKRQAARESRKEQEAEQLRADLQQKSERELLTLLKRLKQRGE